MRQNTRWSTGNGKHFLHHVSYLVVDFFSSDFGGDMKITVNDDFLPNLSSIELVDIQKDWAWARQHAREHLLQHRFLGLGHIEKSLGHDEDAETYFFLANVLEAA